MVPQPTVRTVQGWMYQQWGGRFTLEYLTPSPPVTETRHQQQCTGSSKKRAYQQRIQEVEHSSFIPLVLSATGGMGNEATIFYKRLASLLSHSIQYDSMLATVLPELLPPLIAHLSKQSEMPDPLRDMQWGHQLPSTLLPLNLTSQRTISDLLYFIKPFVI